MTDTDTWETLDGIRKALERIADALESPVISPATNYSAPPEISPEIDDGEELVLVTDGDVEKALVGAKFNPDEFEIQDAEYYTFVKNKDYWAGDEGKAKFKRANDALKKIGFERISAGKDSRWERKKEVE